LDDVPHPGDLERHIMRDLGFGVVASGDEMHGSAQVVAEMWVPGTTALRTSILAAWADVVAGHIAIGLFEPGVPVTLDLDIHLHRPPVGCDEVRMVARVQKAGRSVSVLSIDITDGGADPIGFAHATFMAAPNPSLRMPTVVRDAGLLRPHPSRLGVPFAERAGCDRVAPGLASIPLRPDGLNASGTLNRRASRARRRGGRALGRTRDHGVVTDDALRATGAGGARRRSGGAARRARRRGRAGCGARRPSRGHRHGAPVRVIDVVGTAEEGPAGMSN
jgi:acyl-coenzyme A thioesterase PaaI-like protein